jgi:hypothetical protein
MVEPINIYTFGNIKYDAEPLMRTYALIEKKREAMNQAFDKYLESQAKNVNLNEIRKQDREAFQDMYDELKSAGIANKKRILNDRQARLEYEQGWNMLSNFASQSKEEEKAKQPYLSKLASRDGREQFNMERFGKALASHDLPMFTKDQSGAYVSNPSRKSLDMMGDYFDPKPIKFPELFSNWSKNKERIELKGGYVKNDPNTPEGRDLIKREKIKQTVTKGFTPVAIKEIGVNAFEDVKSNEPVLSFYEREYQNIKNTQELLDLDVTLKKYFPNETINSAPLLAKAKALKAAEEASDTYFDIVTDDEAQLSRRKRERAEDRSSSGGGTPDVNVFDVIDVNLPNPSYSGSLKVPTNKVPAKLLLAMKGLGYSSGFSGVEFQVQNGKIMSVSPAGFTSFGKPSAPITRDEILIGQQKAGTKIDWGGSKSTKVNKKDRLDLGL